MLRALARAARSRTAAGGAATHVSTHTARGIPTPQAQARTLWSNATANAAAASMPRRFGSACASCLSAAAAVRCDAARRFLSSSSARVAALASPASPAVAAVPSSHAPAASSLHARLRSCSMRGESARASTLLSEFEARGGRIDTTLLSMQLGCHAASGDWEGAERVWARFAELRLQPDSLSYRNLIKAYTNAGGAQQLAKIDQRLEEMQRAGISFSGGELAHLQKTARLCMLPDEVRRWATVAALARSSASPGAAKPTRSSESPVVAAVAAVAPSVDPAALLSQLRLCVTNGDTVRASQAVRDFESAGGRCDLTMLTLWIIAHIPSGDWTGADRVWARMAELGLRPDSVAYCSLIQVYLRSGDEQRARIDGLLAEMRRGAGLTFTNTGYEHLLLSAHTLKLPHEVRRFSDHARKAQRLHLLDPAVRNIAAEAAASAPAIEGSGLNGDARLSPQRGRRLVSDRSSREFSAALAKKVSELSVSGDAKAAELLIAESERCGVVLDVGVLTAWLGCYRKHGDWVGAERVWRRMHYLKVVPTNTTYCNLILVYLQNGSMEQLGKIDNLLYKMRRQGLRFTSRDYQQVIETFHACKLTSRMQQWSSHASAAALFGRTNDAAGQRGSKDSKRVGAAAAEEKKQRPVAASEQQAAIDTTPASAASPEPAASASPIPISDSDPSALMARLRGWIRRGHYVRAAHAVRKFERKGGVLDPELVNAWLSCHRSRGDWKGAERVWAHMQALKLSPSSACYATLIQIYMKAGDAQQLAKIDPLLSSMQATPDLEFSDEELTRLLQCALRCALPNEVHRWSFRAPAASIYAPPSRARSRARSTPASRARAIKVHSDARSSRRPTRLVSSSHVSNAPQHRAYHRSASAPRPFRADTAATSSPPSGSISSSSSSSFDPADSAAAVARAELDRVVASEAARDATRQSTARDAKAQSARRKQAARERDRKEAAEERRLYKQYAKPAATPSRSHIGLAVVPFSSQDLEIISPKKKHTATTPPSSSPSSSPSSATSLLHLSLGPVDLQSSVHVATFRRVLQQDNMCGSAASDEALDLALKTSGQEDAVDRVVVEWAMQSVLARLQRDHQRSVPSDPALLERATMIWREAKTRNLLSAVLVHTMLQCYSARGDGYNAPAQLDLLSEAVSQEPELQRNLRVGAVKPVLVLAKSYTLALRSMVVAFQQEGVLTQPAQFAEAQQIGREIFGQLLHRISSQRMFSDLVSSWSEWRSLLTVLRTLKLYDLVRLDAWRTMREQQEQEISKWRDHRVQQGLEAHSIPPLMRIPSKILTLLVHCAVEEHGDRAGVRAARSLIEELQRPETMDRFEAPPGMLLSTLLEAYAACANPDLTELRAVYDAIEPKSAESHGIMLRAYFSQRHLQEASQLCAELEIQPALDAASAAAVLASLAEMAAPQQADLAESAVQRAEALWARVKADPAQLASAEVTRGMLHVLHQRRDGKRCVEVMAEALQLESAATPLFSAAGPPVCVDALAYSVLFNTCAQSSEPKLFEADAERAFEELKARHTEALKQGRKARAAALAIQPAVRDSYARLRQRCNPASYPSLELLRASPARARTTHSYLQPLRELAEAGDVSGAEALIAEFEASKRRWNVDLLAAWIEVYRVSADCAAAERVWQRITELGLTPNAAALSALMQVYMHSGAMSKLAALSSRPSLPRLRVRDLDHLIFTAARCNLPDQIAAFAHRAREMQLWEQLNPKVVRIATKIERKMQQPASLAARAVLEPQSAASWSPTAAPPSVDAAVVSVASESLYAASEGVAAVSVPAAPLPAAAVPSASASRLLRAGNALQQAMVVASSLSTKANPAELTGRIWLKLHLRALDAVEAFITRVTGGR